MPELTKSEIDHLLAIREAAKELVRNVNEVGYTTGNAVGQTWQFKRLEFALTNPPK